MNFSQLQGERYKRLPIGAQIISDCKVMHRLQGYRGNWSLESVGFRAIGDEGITSCLDEALLLIEFMEF